MIRSLDRPRSPFTDSRIKFVLGLHNTLTISYKLSPQYDVPALKTLALDHIRGEVGKYDVVEETFSRFASQ